MGYGLERKFKMSLKNDIDLSESALHAERLLIFSCRVEAICLNDTEIRRR